MNPTMFRPLACIFGILAALPALVLTALALVTPISVSGIIYLLGYWLVAVGMMLAPWQPRYYLVPLAAGVAAIALMASARLGVFWNKPSSIEVMVLPSATPTRWVNWLVDEQDSLLFGEAIMYRLGGVTMHEHDGLVPALSGGYADARSAHGEFASPFMSTYLGLQRSSAFDAVVVEPAVEGPSPIGVVFLHGYMGNVSLQCWQIAQAASQAGAVTVCPSTSWIGDWWKPGGQAIVQAAFDYLRGRGIERIYLGGFSNGGVGIGSLIQSLASEPGLSGLFFIAGTHNAAGVRQTGLPVLVIQGTGDERMSAQVARQFVSDVGELAIYIELEADHFLIMKQSYQVQAAIRGWLDGREAGR